MIFFLTCLLFTVSVAYHCENATTEAQCDDMLVKGVACKWNTTSSDCYYVNCVAFENTEECEANEKYGCEWRTVNDTLMGAGNPNNETQFCYTDCPTNVTVVFVADISSSVIANDSEADMNVENYRRFIIQSMDLIWKTHEQHTTPTGASFALVLFARSSIITFDLSRQYTLDQYLRMTSAAIRKETFKISPEFNGNTNTTGALETAYQVVTTRAPEFATYQPLVLTVTDGKPNLPYPASPCAPQYNLAPRYKDASISAGFVLVGFDYEAFDCFLEVLGEHASVSRVDDFGALRNSMSSLTASICPEVTKAPTIRTTWARPPTPRPTFATTTTWHQRQGQRQGQQQMQFPFMAMPVYGYPFYQPQQAPQMSPQMRGHMLNYFKNYYEQHKHEMPHRR